MPLSYQLQIFSENWRAKAAAYRPDDLAGAFDRFFTSYVVFNRLYAEATYRLARRGQLVLRENFPDSRAAQDYVLQFCGAGTLTRAWDENEDSTAAIRDIAGHLRDGRFALKLHPATGDRRPEKDEALADMLQSANPGQRAKGVLEALYAIRCNMFHGQKGFEVAQLALLQPAISLLERTVEILYRALEQDAE